MCGDNSSCDDGECDVARVVIMVHVMTVRVVIMVHVMMVRVVIKVHVMTVRVMLTRVVIVVHVMTVRVMVVSKCGGAGDACVGVRAMIARCVNHHPPHKCAMVCYVVPWNTGTHLTLHRELSSFCHP